MSIDASKLYERATDTVRDWAETVRDEMPDMKDVRSAADDMTGKAGDWAGDAAERFGALMPKAAARAARKARRRRWLAGAVVLGIAAWLFGPGGAERRSATKNKLSTMFGGSAGSGTKNPSMSTPSYRKDPGDSA